MYDSLCIGLCIARSSAILPVMTQAEKLIGTAEASQRLNMDRSTLTRKVSNGLIRPALRGSGKTGEYFFTEEEIAKQITIRNSPEAVAL